MLLCDSEYNMLYHRGTLYIIDVSQVSPDPIPEKFQVMQCESLNIKNDLLYIELFGIPSRIL
jgi:serine/threonine-protein kinase RIO1